MKSITKKTKMKRINKTYLSIPLTFEEVLEKLSIPDYQLTSIQLAEFSDLSEKYLKQFKHVWADVPVQKRREITSELADISEDNIEYDFSAILRIGLDDEDDEVLHNSVTGLWENVDYWLEKKLLQLAKYDPHSKVRIAATRELEKFSLKAELEKDSPQNRISLAEQLLAIFYDQTSDPKARCAALEAVSPINLDHVYQAIDIAYKDDEPEFKVSAIYAMGTNANPSWLPVIISELSNPDPEMRYEAAHAAGELGQEDALPDLLLLAQDDDKDVQVAAILALGKIGGREARQNLVKLAEHSDQAIREAAEQSLHELELSNNPFSIKSFDCNNSSSS